MQVRLSPPPEAEQECSGLEEVPTLCFKIDQSYSSAPVPVGYGEWEAGDEEEEEDDRHDDHQQRVEGHRGRALSPVRALQLQHHGLVSARNEPSRSFHNHREGLY